MRKVKIAVIGTSRYGHGWHIFNSLKGQTDFFDLAGYAFPEGEREKFPDIAKRYEEYPELTVEEIMNNPEIEAVAIETEERYLTKYTHLAAKHHKHIHMEKPGGTNLVEFEAMMKAVKEGNKVFHTGYMYRYNPYIMELMEQIGNGELGEIFSVEAQMNCRHNKEMRQWLNAFPGGMMFYLGCHLVDLVLQICGMPQKIIPMNRRSGFEGVSSVDEAMAAFVYKNGVSFVKTTAVEKGGYHRRQLVVTGSEKTVELKPLEWHVENGQVTGRTEYSQTNWHDGGVREVTEAHDRYDAMMASFAAMVRGEKENPWDCDYELTLYKTILKCCEE